MGQGSDLGRATGHLTIDVSQLDAARAAVRDFATGVNTNLTGINASVNRTEQAFTRLRSIVQQVGSVFGVTFGAAGVAQLARYVVEADAVATAYRRQNVAAVALAGSQEELNQLLATYQRVSGGAVDSATALASVTNLMAVGFADSTAELEKFATAIRGISIAKGVTQEFVTQNLILELFSQRGQRLDQLGLDYEKVRQAAEKLRQTDRSVTQEMAYQQAVLEQAIERFGELTRSAEGAATGMELVGRTLKEARLEIGKSIGPAADLVGTFAATAIILEIGKLRAFVKAFNEDIQELVDSWQLLLRLMGLAQTPGAPAAAPTTATSSAPRLSDEQTAVIVDWWQKTQDIERQANQDRLEATRQYEQQRTETIRQYEQTIARDAEDFALSRARAEEDYALGLQRTHRDIAQRETRQLQELERTISEARMDAAERAADRQVATEEQLAETRAAAQERVADIESDFNRRRERAARDHQESIAEAAGRLDALAVSKQQREFAKRQRNEKEDFDERLAKERKNEEKRLAEIEKRYAKQTADEQKALEKRVKQANDSYQRQLEEARAADAQRIEDMAADFQLRQERENEDRAIRLERLKQDHENQLGELARQHEARLLQIGEQEQAARDKLDEEFQKELDALGIRTQKYKEKLKGYEDAAIEAFDRVWAHWLGATQGPQPLNPLITPGQFPSLGTPVVSPGGGVTSNRNMTLVLGEGSIQIYPALNQSPLDIARAVRVQIEDILRELAE